MPEKLEATKTGGILLKILEDLERGAGYEDISIECLTDYIKKMEKEKRVFLYKWDRSSEGKLVSEGLWDDILALSSANLLELSQTPSDKKAYVRFTKGGRETASSLYLPKRLEDILQR